MSKVERLYHLHNILNQRRTPISRQDLMERLECSQATLYRLVAELRDFLGATRVLWLAGGIEGDDTDGHIDDVARFVDANTVVTVVIRQGRMRRRPAASVASRMSATDSSRRRRKVCCR